MNSIALNIQEIRRKVAKAAGLSGRKPDAIDIVAVTKTIPIPDIEKAITAGICKIGENRVQELAKKHGKINNQIEWHMIGHLQTNKTRQIIDKADLIHSLDRWSLALELNKRSALVGKIMPVLIQVNIAKEETKFGLYQKEVIPFIEEAIQLPNIAIKGLMTMAPFVENPEEVRSVFKALFTLSKKIESMELKGVKMDYLSMGMTNDYEVAIEEGANLIRIGSGIFGKNN